MKWKLLILSLLTLSSMVKSQEATRPKLVVGLVVDQMRWDYFYRYENRYTMGGFKRLLREGFNCENAFIDYTPTYTAAGHSSVYTGSVPALNGIMGNNWYDPQQKRVVYCTEDNSVNSVGSTTAAGRMSPRNLWSNTITDELRLATNFKGKTVAIALKDRGAILPGGHTANGAYWFDNAIGGMISSSFYMNELPKWVQDFNNRKLPDAYLKENWNTLFPIDTYTQSTSDDNVYEGRFPGEDNSFPHQTDTIRSNRFESFKYMPQGNTYTFEMGKAAIEGESLGYDAQTDFLALSFSSTDYAGHSFGPNSIEMEDMYLRFDRDLASFLQYLDAKIGRRQYVLFITADHGAAHNPRYLNDQRIPGGTYDQAATQKLINDSLKARYGQSGLISSFINYQVYLNDSLVDGLRIDRSVLKGQLKKWLLQNAAVSQVVDLDNLATETVQPQLKRMLTNGYNQKLSGDLQVIFKPQWFETWRTGTTHGLWNPYDAHIPLLFFGWKVKPGRTTREVYMHDIAATLAAALRIQMPNASVGKVIEEAFRR